MRVEPRTWLREAREAAGYTQMGAAVELEVTTTTVQNWESGLKPPMPAHAREIDRLLAGGSGVIKARFDAERQAAKREALSARRKVPA